MEIVPAASVSPKHNQLLAALPEADYQRLAAQLEPVQMQAGQLLHGAAAPMRHVWFPVNGIASMLSTMRNGNATEIAMIGNEGMVGISLLTGGTHAQTDIVVKTPGLGYRLREGIIREEFRRCDSLRNILLRYTHALFAQTAQIAACNRHHSIEQQLCRFLLSSLDRLSSSELRMTQEFIANALGVRRESVTDAARRLQGAGLIRYRRGRIKVIDRRGLESGVCECYAVVRHEHEAMRNDIAMARCREAEGRIAA
jgi:CRP-like cAMP-binding protein